ncbi:MAG: aminotransferase class IV [Gemmatimonadetes bacterium]|nr:aminotransferase class IV [Gemmatimonadota bacterium]MBA3890667.1 aminotransferase class IV [Gemmatimonadaceae bacterium]
MSRIIHLSGEYLPSNEARIDVDDRGFLFGDGVYEAMRALDGTLIEGDAHLLRLQRGLAGLEFQLHPAVDSAALSSTCLRLLELNDLKEGHALVYLQVTRGVAQRSHHFPNDPVQPTVYASTTRFTPPRELQENGAAAITQQDQRWKRCDLKTINLLPNVLAKQHAREAGAIEAILLRDRVVTEGSHTNVFAVLGGVVRTHPRTAEILHGVTREVVLSLAGAAGLPVEERAIDALELPLAEEVFLTGTTTDLIPITRIDGRQVGSGRPGPFARMLLERYLALMRDAAPFPQVLVRSR